MNIPFSWTGGAYFINKHTAQLFYENILPITFPMDFELNYLQNKLKSKVYWLETPIVFEGSNPVSGSLYRYTSSLGR